MSLYGKPNQKTPISALRRKAIYSLGHQAAGHAKGVELVALWEDTIGSTEQIDQGIPQFVRFMQRQSSLGGTGELAFGERLTKILSSPESIAVLDTKSDPLLLVERERPDSLQTSLARSLEVFLTILVQAIRKSDPKTLNETVKQLLANASLTTECRAAVAGLIKERSSSLGNYQPTRMEGQKVVHMLYVNLLEGIGPIEADALYKMAIRQSEGTTQNDAYSVRQFL